MTWLAQNAQTHNDIQGTATLRGRNRKASAAFFLLALCYGAVLGYIRVAQGGHFVSDVLWSGGLVYLVCASLYYLLRLDAFPAGTFKRINTKEAS